MSKASSRTRADSVYLSALDSWGDRRTSGSFNNSSGGAGAGHGVGGDDVGTGVGVGGGVGVGNGSDVTVKEEEEEGSRWGNFTSTGAPPLSLCPDEPPGLSKSCPVPQSLLFACGQPC